jgi:Golgi phosphoprotein 3 (GPP34)
MLTIPEEVLLAEISRARTGLCKTNLGRLSFLNQVLAAGCLIELVLADRVTVERRRRHLLWSQAIVIVDATPIGDSLLEAALERVGAGDPRSCSYWASRLGKGSREAYWDRLVAKSLLRPDTLGPNPETHFPDTNSAAAITDRIRAVIEQRPSVNLRDAALVTLLAQSKILLPLLHEPRWNPAALIREHRDKQSEDRLGRKAIDDYKDLAPSPATADAIRTIAWAARPPERGDVGI